MDEPDQPPLSCISQAQWKSGITQKCVGHEPVLHRIIVAINIFVFSSRIASAFYEKMRGNSIYKLFLMKKRNYIWEKDFMVIYS